MSCGLQDAASGELNMSESKFLIADVSFEMDLVTLHKDVPIYSKMVCILSFPSAQ